MSITSTRKLLDTLNEWETANKYYGNDPGATDQYTLCAIANSLLCLAQKENISLEELVPDIEWLEACSERYVKREIQEEEAWASMDDPRDA